jgi:GR25 family glycosyltransferase involved in LPS biosynthesis
MLHILAIADVNSAKGKITKQRLVDLGVSFEIIPAVFPSEPYPWSALYDEKRRMQLNGYPLVKGEVGCFLAHREAWKAVVMGQHESVLILEDDFKISPEDLPKITSIAEIKESKNLITLLFIANHELSFRSWLKLGDVQIVVPTVKAYSTLAYFVSKQSAARLLKHSESIFCPVDEFTNMESLHGIPLVCTFPLLVSQDGSDSTIGHRVKPAIKTRQKLIRNYFRFIWMIREKISRLKTLIKLDLIGTKVETRRNHS